MRDKLSQKTRIAFDSSTLLHFVSYIKNQKLPENIAQEMPALKIIFHSKDASWIFILIDSVRRESEDKKHAYKTNIVVDTFNERISLSRFPIVFPVTFPSETQQKTEEKYRKLGNLSQEDAVIIADSINANCNYLITTDFRMLNNHYALKLAKQDGTIISKPSNFTIELAV